MTNRRRLRAWTEEELRTLGCILGFVLIGYWGLTEYHPDQYEVGLVALLIAQRAIPWHRRTED